MTVRRLLGLLLAAALLALPAAAAAGAGPVTCNGLRSLCDKRFDRVVLPATHNSMSAYSLGWSIPNQPIGVPQQLALGVRGFLWDTYYGHRGSDRKVATHQDGKRPGDRLYLCHVVCANGATPLADVLRSLRDFLRAHPNEVVAIVNEDYITPRDYVAAIRATGLARYIYRGPTGPRWPTLRTMIRRRQRVVLLAEHHAGAASWYHLAYNGILQETPYNWPKPEQITSPSNWKSSCVPNRGGRHGSLFLMNHWSPPIAPAPANSAKVNAYRVLVGRAKACGRARGRLPNFVAVDQFLSGDLFRAVRALNALQR